MYTMYVMYTIVEFRKCLRQAFNDAEQGHEVVIERWGNKYQLVALVDKPLPGHQMESVPGKLAELKRAAPLNVPRKSVERGLDAVSESTETHQVPRPTQPKIIKTPKEAVLFISNASAFKPCKHGMDPKFCKFARPGKPCKT